MANVSSSELEILRAPGNTLNFSTMTQLSDGRFVSVGRSLAPNFSTVGVAEIRLVDPDTGAVMQLPGLNADTLRGTPQGPATGAYHNMHNVVAAALPDGGFVVGVQINQNINGSFSNYEQVVYLQFYNADGSTRGAPVRGRNPERAGGDDPGSMSLEADNVALIATPEGVVLVFKQSVGTLTDPARPGMVARFFDPQGHEQATHTLFTERGELPGAAIVEEDQLLLVWGVRSNASTPVAVHTQSFALHGTPLNARITNTDIGAPYQAKLLVVSDTVVKLLYLASPFSPRDLRMVDLNSDGQVIGTPVTLLTGSDAPVGSGNWTLRDFDAALDAQGGITVALEVEITGGTTREDIFLTAFNLDGSLRSSPVLASASATGIQQDPVLFPQEDGTLFLQFMQSLNPQVSGATQLMGVSVDPALVISPVMAVELALTLPQGIMRDDVLVTFRSEDGQTEFTALSTPNGYRFEIGAGQANGLAGRIEITKPWTPTAGDPAITASDALDILRMAVGLTPSFGPPAVGNLIAADLNGDGIISAADALEALRAAVGLASANPPRWVFLDLDLDLSHMNAGNVSYQTGIAVPDFSGLADLNLGGILLGYMGTAT